jgi:diamine N-acetyltransferase
MLTTSAYGGEMAAFTLEELSADTAEQANTLEMLPGQERFANPVTYEQADGTIEVTNTWSRVIRSGGEVVGFVRAYFDSDYATEELRCCVWRVSVSANAQGKGVGRFAIEAVKREALQRGFSHLSALWQSSDEGPGNFFRKLGFTETGQSDYGDTIGTMPLR